MRSAIKILISVAAVTLIVTVLYPFPQTIAPDWRISVVDEHGVRLSQIHVRQTWQQLSVESKGHEEVLATDIKGTVHFPKRVLKSCYLRRAYGCWQQRHVRGASGVCGPQASVWAFGPGLGTLHDEDTRDSTGLIVTSEIWPDRVAEQQTSIFLLHHCPPGRVGPGCRLSDEYLPTSSARD